MRYVDLYILSLYNSYKYIHKKAPWAVEWGPVNLASTIAALYPTLVLFSLTVPLKLWNTEAKMTQQFIVFVSLITFMVFLSFYFEKRIFKVRSQYADEFKSNSFFRTLAVNLFIGICITFFALSMKQIL
jgi:hypothetical protein